MKPPDQRDIALKISGNRRRDKDSHTEDVLGLEGTDVLVLQRITHQFMAEAIPVLRRRGIAVVIDVDDDLTSIHPNNPAYRGYHPKYQWTISRKTGEFNRNSWLHLKAACRDATMVTVSTPALLNIYATRGQGRVIYNHLPAHYYGVDHQDSDRIGWPASLVSHPDDPSALGGAMARLCTDPGDFQVVGDPSGCGVAFGLTRDPSGFMEPISLEQWPVRIAQNIGIGIAPLADTRFNRCKCVDSSMRICTHRGILEARNIVVGDQVWRNGWKAVEAVKHDVPTPGFEIETEGGYRLRLTPDHRMMVNGEWTYAKDILAGDRMAMEPEPVGPSESVRAPWPADSRMGSRGATPTDPLAYLTAPDSPRVDITPRWGRFLGAFVGDGCAGQSTQLTISCDGQDQDWIDLLMEDFRAFGFNPITQNRRTFSGEIIRRRDVRIASAHLLRVLNGWDLTEIRDNGRPLRKVRVPEIIWSSPREVIAEFLAGYFEADGTCTSSGVQAVSKDEQLIRDIQRLLLLFGIVSKVRTRTTTAQNGFRGTAWTVNLGRDAADVFAKEIGFRSARKTARLKEITSRPHSNAFRPMDWNPKVISVRPCMVEPVDIQVEDHEYMAAGFVSHNSWLKPMELSALGIPWVASPRAEYERLHKLGCGLLADTPNRWFKTLRRLQQSPALRADLSATGRGVADGFRLEANAWRWLESWTDAYERERRRDRAPVVVA